MAENKKSFILYADLINIVSKLPDEHSGKLFKIILEYVNDKKPVIEDLLLQIAFEPIKLQLKRDLVKYEDTKLDKITSGILGNLKRWHIDLYDKVKSNEIELEKAVEIAKHRKASHTDTLLSHPVANIAVNDNVNVTVNDNVINIDSRKLKFADTLKPFLAIYGKDLLNDFFHYWTEANKSKTKMKFELQKTWEVSLRLKKWSSNNFGNTNKIFNKADIIAPDYEAFVKG